MCQCWQKHKDWTQHQLLDRLKEIVELELAPEEMNELKKSAEAIREQISIIKDKI